MAFNDMYEHRDSHFGNGRTARNVFEKAIHQQANRLAGIVDDGIGEIGKDAKAGEGAEGAEGVAHAESAEGAAEKPHAESAESAEDESHAESAEPEP